MTESLSDALTFLAYALCGLLALGAVAWAVVAALVLRRARAFDRDMSEFGREFEERRASIGPGARRAPKRFEL